MGCNCAKRGKLIGAAVKAIKAGKPVAPIVRGFGRTITTDLRTVVRVISPRVGR